VVRAKTANDTPPGLNAAGFGCTPSIFPMGSSAQTEAAKSSGKMIDKSGNFGITASLLVKVERNSSKTQWHARKFHKNQGRLKVSTLPQRSNPAKFGGLPERALATRRGGNQVDGLRRGSAA